MTDIQDIPDRNSQVETLLNQMNERLQQLEQENNEMRAQNLLYQHQTIRKEISSGRETQITRI